jgi:hypothetical protein
VRDGLTCVDGELPLAIVTRGAGRDDFADPIRREGEVRRLGNGRQALAAPAGEVGHENIVSEVQLGLVEDPPAPWTTAAAVIRRPELASQDGRRHSVTWSGPGRHDELAGDDLANDVLGQRQQIVVRGWPRA